MLLGEVEHALDDKGRIALPAKFRPELAEGLVITRGIDRCLVIWPLDEWRLISEKLSQQSLMNSDARRLHRLIFAGATDLEPDRLGRILLPAFLREYAELRDSVVFAGLLHCIELWSRSNWQAERSLAEAQSAQLAEHLFNQGA